MPRTTQSRRPALLVRTVLVCLLVAACSANDVDERSSQGSVELTECRLSGFGGFRKAKALCGTLTVPLNPAEPNGRSITLALAKIPALSRKPASSAFTLLAGGPGQSALESYVSLRDTFERLRREHDIILVDQRGTGQSNKQQCTSFQQGEESALIEASPEASKQAAQLCIDDLGSDAKFYTTSLAVQDLEAVRAALGYAQLDLYGVSYGTRVAQHYLRRFPEHTRTVILDGIVPVTVPLGPGIAIDAQNALDRIFNRCKEDTLCYVQFGDLFNKFEQLSNRLKENSAVFDMPDPISGETITTTFGYGELIMAVRLMTYSPDTTSLLPLMISKAEEGNYLPLATQALLNGELLSEMLAFGMHNTVICSEDVPLFTSLEVDLDELQRTYIGDLSYLSMIEMCAVWPRGPTDADFGDSFKSQKPVLLLSGEFDPVTPPANADAVAEYLTNSRSIVVAGQGHNVGPIGCLPRIMADFVIQGSHKELDISCLDIHQPSPFFNSFSGAEP